MVDSDDPFKTQDATVIRPRPGAGKRGVSDPLGARPTMMPMPAPVPVPEAAREGLAIGLNPLVQAASPLLRLAGHARSVHSSLDIPDLRRQALEDIRSFEDRARAAGVPQRDRPGGAVRAVCHRGRSGHVHARGLAERVGPESPAGRAASRGMGRREVLRDAGPHLARPGPAHRPDGTPVRVPRPGLHGQVPHDGPRPRAAGGGARRPLSHDPQPAGQAPERARRCDGKASRIGATGWCGTSPGGSPRSAWSPS